MKVIAWSPNLTPEKCAEAGVTYASKEELFKTADVITIHVVLGPRSRGLVGREDLLRMKPTAYIVNTARGEVIDENELARLIEAGQIAGAGLDVFEHEPAINPKLLASDRVVALPHMGSATLEGRIDMGEKVIINIKTFLDGHTPPDRVHAAMF
jgi:glyoxylate reductase